MSVLVEGISVIVRVSALDRYPGGWSAFRAAVPNETLCADSELVRVGFMNPADVKAYINELEQLGLRYIVDGAAEDIVVADQLRGFAVPCDWAECGRGDFSSGREVTVCRLKNSKVDQFVTPEGWAWEKSLSASFGFVPTEAQDSLTKVNEDDGIEEFNSPLTEKPAYSGRTSKRKPNLN
jgi:hypothetical protein